MVHQLDEFDDTRSFLCSWGFQGLTGFIFRCMRQQSQSFCTLDSQFLLTKLGSIVHSVLLFLLPYAACFHCRHDAVACLQQEESKFANLVRNSWKLISSVGHSVFDKEQIEAASLGDETFLDKGAGVVG